MRTARCRCGAVEAQCHGEPIRISVCHCLQCQRRTGSAFAAQARFPEERVLISGAVQMFERIADSGRRASYRFCPLCGSTIAYTNEGQDGVVAVPLGAFADPNFPAPGFSVYESRKYRWVDITDDGVTHTP